MIRCGFEQGAALMGCTSVQNIFILEYMPKAPELYCKVYLFGLMQCGCRRLENADLCASLGIDSAKAVEAFLYWQDMGLLRIVEQEPLSVEYLSVQAGPVTGGTRKYAPLVSALRQVCGARVLTPGELSKIYDWIEVFGLEEAAAVMLVRRCMELKGPSVKIQFMDKMAREWAKEGVLTAADAEQRIKLDTELQGGAKAILARWRKGRMATEDELALYKKWTEEWGMTLDEILSACPAMTSSDKPTFAYLNAILEGMRMEGGVQEAIKSAALTEELAREIYSRAGLKGAPGRREKEAVSTWTVSWHMQPEAVLLAAERSAGYSHPFDRTRRLIEQLHEKGVTTLQQARKAIEELEKQPAAEGGKKQQSSYFMNYGQRKYSDEDLKSIGITLLEDEETKMKPTPELIYEYRMSRERAEREARERREAACTAIPRLREIADQRRRLAFDTGLMIMRGEDSSELRNKVEQLDKEELNLLLSAGLPPDHMLPHYRCKACNDTGYVGDTVKKLCPCMKARILEEMYATSGIDTQQSSQCFAPTYTRAIARSASP